MAQHLLTRRHRGAVPAGWGCARRCCCSTSPAPPRLVLLARRRWLRSAFRRLRRPLVGAAALRADGLRVAHLTVRGRARHPLLHGWSTSARLAAEPAAVVAGDRADADAAWGGSSRKIGYIFAARMSTMFLGMISSLTREASLYADVSAADAPGDRRPGRPAQRRRPDDDARHRDDGRRRPRFFWLAVARARRLGRAPAHRPAPRSARLSDGQGPLHAGLRVAGHRAVVRVRAGREVRRDRDAALGRRWAPCPCRRSRCRAGRPRRWRTRS